MSGSKILCLRAVKYAVAEVVRMAAALAASLDFVSCCLGSAHSPYTLSEEGEEGSLLVAKE
eukprot:140838-Pyramimonas_sp.AAC.1